MIDPAGSATAHAVDLPSLDDDDGVVTTPASQFEVTERVQATRHATPTNFVRAAPRRKGPIVVGRAVRGRGRGGIAMFIAFGGSSPAGHRRPSLRRRRRRVAGTGCCATAERRRSRRAARRRRPCRVNASSDGRRARAEAAAAEPHPVESEPCQAGGASRRRPQASAGAARARARTPVAKPKPKRTNPHGTPIRRSCRCAPTSTDRARRRCCSPRRRALAAPKCRAAKAQFDKGVAAYSKGDFAAASLAFGKSYALEVDVETLFAWAQAERKQGHCDKASELYVKLLATKLPAENKAVVQDQLDECKKILDDEQATAAAANAERTSQAARGQQARVEPPPPRTPPHRSTLVAGPRRAIRSRDRHRHPLVQGSRRRHARRRSASPGVAVGSVLLLSASSAAADSKTASTYDQFKLLDDKAKSRGIYGVIATCAGAALIIGGVIRYATRSTSTESTTVTGWLSHSSGIALTGGL